MKNQDSRNEFEKKLDDIRMQPLLISESNNAKEAPNIPKLHMLNAKNMEHE